jgi:PAS domain S-box-containing protein
MENDCKKLKRREEKLLLLHKLGVELVSSSKLEEVLTKIVESATIIAEAEEAALFLLDETGKQLFLRALKSLDEKAAKAMNKDVTDRIKGSTVDKSKDIMLNSKEVELATGHIPKSLLRMPLRTEEEVLGSLCVYNCQQEKQITKDDEELLLNLTDYVANTIKNTTLLDEALLRAETLSALYDVSQSMLIEMNLEKLLKIIVDNALNVLGADIVVLYEYLKGGEDVKIPPIYKGRDIKTLEWLTDRRETHKSSVVFKVLHRDKPFYAPNASEDWSTLYSPESKRSNRKDDFIHRENIVSSAGIPLCITGKPVGVIFINYRSFCAFTPHQRIRIESFANQAALAIRNAKIFAQRDRYINELSVLNTIIQEISSGVTLSIGAILNLIYEQTGRLMDVTNFFVAFYHHENETVSFEYAVEEGQIQETGMGQFKERKAGKGLTEYVIRTKKTLRISSKIYEWLDNHGVDAIGTPVKSWLGTPMIFQDVTLGVIVTQNTEKENAYDKRNEEILETIASQAAIAIAKARLFQESQNQLAELNSLYNISQEIISKSTDIMSVLKTILDKAVELSNADAGQILFHNDTTESNTTVLFHKSEVMSGIILEPGEGMAGEVVKTGKPLYTNDYYNSPYMAKQLDKPKFRNSIKGMVVVPMKWQDKLLGVLVLTYRPSSKRIFTTKDVELIKHFAGPASTAIVIARNISLRQTILNDSPDAIIAVDRKGLITQFNKSSERIMGFKRKEVIGTHVRNSYYEGEEEARRINHILIESEKRGEVVMNITTAVRDRNGERIPILFAGWILRNELDEMIGSIGLMTDLREIVQLDKEYRRQQDFLAEIEQYPQDTPINTQADLQKRKTKILEMTRDFCKLEYIILFASTAEDDTVLKAIAWIGLPPDVQKRLPHFNWRKAGLLIESDNKESTLRIEAELINQWQPDDKWKRTIVSGIRGKNMDFFSNLSCGVPVRLADNYRAVLIFGPFTDNPDLFKIKSFIHNIAQTINTNALSWAQALYLRAKNKDTERSKRLIIHRTRMQLQQIIGKFGLIKSGVAKGSTINREAIEGEGLVEHLSNILTRALTSHIAEMEPQDFHFQPFPLPALIQNCVEDFRKSAHFWGRELIVDPDIEFLPYAEVDPLMLSIALGNLIENALKYSYEKTTVQIFSKYDDKEAEIIVQDFGEEMSEKARENLFHPGMRWGMTPRARGLPGTGFGLWDSSVIANAHGGKLDFSSGYIKKGKPGNIVKVWMILPLKQGKS